MFSLIVTIISIALAIALAVAVIYYGGSSQRQGASKAAAATLLNQGAQIAAAGAVAVTQGSGWPADSPMFGQPYLTAMPTPPQSSYHSSVAAPAQTDWSYYVPRTANHFVLDRKIKRDVCFEINKATGVIGIPAAWDGKNIIQCFGPSEPYTFFYDPPGALSSTEVEDSIDKSVNEGGPGATPGYPRFCPDGTSITTGVCPVVSAVPGGDGNTHPLTATPTAVTSDGLIDDDGDWVIWHEEDLGSTFDIRPTAHMELCPAPGAPAFEQWELFRVFFNGEESYDFDVEALYNYDASNGTAPSTPKVCAYITYWGTFLPLGPTTVELERETDSKRYRGTFTVIPGGVPPPPPPPSFTHLAPTNPSCGDTVTAHGSNLPTAGFASAYIVSTKETRYLPFTYVSSEEVTFQIPKDMCNAGTTGIMMTDEYINEMFTVPEGNPLNIIGPSGPAMTIIGAEGSTMLLLAESQPNQMDYITYFAMSPELETQLRSGNVTISANGDEAPAEFNSQLDRLSVPYRTGTGPTGGKWISMDLSTKTSSANGWDGCIRALDGITKLQCGYPLRLSYVDEGSNTAIPLQVVIKVGGVTVADYTMTPSQTQYTSGDGTGSSWHMNMYYSVTGGQGIYFTNPLYGITSWD